MVGTAGQIGGAGEEDGRATPAKEGEDPERGEK